VDLEYIPVVGYMALLKKPGWGYELAERFGEDSDRVMRVLTMTRIQVEGVVMMFDFAEAFWFLFAR